MRALRYMICFMVCMGLLFITGIKRDHARKPSQNFGEHPNDWFFAQRAFPQKEINHDAYKHAVRHTRVLQKQSGISNYPWTFAGPTNIGGRLTDVEMPAGSFETIYAGAASGGVFKSVNGGQSWIPIFDQEASLSIGDIAIDPHDPRVIYVGTGEVNAGGGSMTYPGTGIYKSVNGGETWTNIGLEDSRYIARIVVDPENSQTVFVAAMGKLFGKNTQRGLFRSMNGGATWENVLFISDSTGCIDIVINPDNPDILYAAMWERIRLPKRRTYGGPSSGLYMSENGGDTWRKLWNGLPNGSVGRIGISLCTKYPETIYTVYADTDGNYIGTYKSVDGGAWWYLTNDYNMTNVFSTYGWWFGNIRVDPNDPQVAFVLGLPLYKTTNGGDSWYNYTYGVHVDQHGMVIHPMDSRFVVLGNDGGLYISENGGSSWTEKFGLPVTQFYTCEIDEQYPYRLYGGTQDNGVNRTYTGDEGQWQFIYGGDGFYVLVDPSDNNYVYTERQRGYFVRSTDGGNRFYYAKTGISSSEWSNWNAPVVFNPVNPKTLYFGTQCVYKSMNRAQSWVPISLDLSNGPYSANDNYTVNFGTVSTIAVAPSDTNVIYAGTDDGNVWVTFDDGGDWTLISGKLPVRWITRVAVDPYDSQTAYVTISGYQWDEYLPHIFRTTNRGESWEDISGNLPEVPLNDIIVDPENTSTLIVASDVGVFFTQDMGGTWQVLGSGLPNVPVPDLDLHNPTRKLVAATYGRSMYTFDLTKITGVEEVASQPADFVLHPNYPNPFNAETVIPFAMDKEQNVLFEIFDVRGRKIRTLANRTFVPGRHEIFWDGKTDDGSPAVSGTYICRLRTEDRMLSGRMTMMK